MHRISVSSLLPLFLSLSPSFSTANAWTTYVVPHSPSSDDISPLSALLNSNSTLTTNASIVFQEGVTYNAWSAIKFPKLTNVEIRMEGNLSLPDSIEIVQGVVGTSAYPGSW
jgi:hypothetical protein